MSRTGWKAQAACARGNADPEVFYPDGWKRDDVDRALAWCAACPVRVECLNHALSWPVSQDFGVWGGTTESQRKALRKVITVMRGQGA